MGRFGDQCKAAGCRFYMGGSEERCEVVGVQPSGCSGWPSWCLVWHIATPITTAPADSHPPLAILHSAFCILHSSLPPSPTVFSYRTVTTSVGAMIMKFAHA